MADIVETAESALRTDLATLEKTKSIFESLFESAPDSTVLVGDRGRILLVNAQTERMFSYSREELIGQPVEILIPDRYRPRHSDHRARYAREPRLRPMGADLELHGRRKDGSEFPVDVMLSPMKSSDGDMVIGIVRDVTERKRFERALREKNLELERANLAKDRFLASMSHELRTPLNAIIGFTGTLLMGLPGPLTLSQTKQLRTVESSAKHLLSLINDLLDLARIESGRVEMNFETVDCKEVVEEVVSTLRPLAAAKGLRFVVDLPAGETIMRTNRRALSQILLNLTNNAIKFTHQGEVMIQLSRSLAAAPDSAPRSVPNATDPLYVTAITLRDTGFGIRPEDRDRLFQAFTQLDTSSTGRPEGTGLGLHLSQRLAELIGGRLECTSEYGKGSTFTLTVLDEPEIARSGRPAGRGD